MADSGVSRSSTLQGWQRESILAAASFLRERFGNPPSDPRARLVHDGLLEVVEPTRRAARLQHDARLGASSERRGGERRRADRRTADVGPPGATKERRVAERRRGHDRRAKR